MKTFYAHPRLPRRTHSAPALPLSFALYKNGALDYDMFIAKRERLQCEYSLHATLDNCETSCACASVTKHKEAHQKQSNEKLTVKPIIVNNTDQRTSSDELQNKHVNNSSPSAWSMQLENCDEVKCNTLTNALADCVENTQNTETKSNTFKMPKQQAKSTVVPSEWENTNAVDVKSEETKLSDAKKVLQRRELFRQYTFLNKPITNSSSSDINSKNKRTKKLNGCKVGNKFLPTSLTHKNNATENTVTSTSLCFTSTIDGNNNNDANYTHSHYDKIECQAERESSRISLTNVNDTPIADHSVSINEQRNISSVSKGTKSNVTSSSSSSSLSMELSQQCRRSLDRIACLLLLLHRPLTPPRPLNRLQESEMFNTTDGKIDKINYTVDFIGTHTEFTTCRQHHSNEAECNVETTLNSTVNSEMNATDMVSCDSICSGGNRSDDTINAERATFAEERSPVAYCESNNRVGTEEMQDDNEVVRSSSRLLNCTPHSARSRSLQNEKNVLGEVACNVHQTPSSLEHTCAHKWRNSCTSLIKDNGSGNHYKIHDDSFEKRDDQESSTEKEHSESLHPVNGIVRFLSPSRRTLFDSYTNNRLYPTFAEHATAKSIPSHFFSTESNTAFVSKVHKSCTSDKKCERNLLSVT